MTDEGSPEANVELQKRTPVRSHPPPAVETVHSEDEEVAQGVYSQMFPGDPDAHSPNRSQFSPTLTAFSSSDSPVNFILRREPTQVLYEKLLRIGSRALADGMIDSDDCEDSTFQHELSEVEETSPALFENFSSQQQFTSLGLIGVTSSEHLLALIASGTLNQELKMKGPNWYSDEQMLGLIKGLRRSDDMRRALLCVSCKKKSIFARHSLGEVIELLGSLEVCTPQELLVALRKGAVLIEGKPLFRKEAVQDLIAFLEADLEVRAESLAPQQRAVEDLITFLDRVVFTHPTPFADFSSTTQFNALEKVSITTPEALISAIAAGTLNTDLKHKGPNWYTVDQVRGIVHSFFAEGDVRRCLLNVGWIKRALFARRDLAELVAELNALNIHTAANFSHALVTGEPELKGADGKPFIRKALVTLLLEDMAADVFTDDDFGDALQTVPAGFLASSQATSSLPAFTPQIETPAPQPTSPTPPPPPCPVDAPSPTITPQQPISFPRAASPMRETPGRSPMKDLVLRQPFEKTPPASPRKIHQKGPVGVPTVLTAKQHLFEVQKAVVEENAFSAGDSVPMETPPRVKRRVRRGVQKPMTPEDYRRFAYAAGTSSPVGIHVGAVPSPAPPSGEPRLPLNGLRTLTTLPTADTPSPLAMYKSPHISPPRSMQPIDHSIQGAVVSGVFQGVGFSPLRGEPLGDLGWGGAVKETIESAARLSEINAAIRTEVVKVQEMRGEAECLEQRSDFEVRMHELALQQHHSRTAASAALKRYSPRREASLASAAPTLDNTVNSIFDTLESKLNQVELQLHAEELADTRSTPQRHGDDFVI